MISVVISKVDRSENKILVRDRQDVNHLKNVFRVKVGDKVRAVDGEKEYLCEVFEIDKKEILLNILEIFEDKFSLQVEIDAGIGILKNDKMELTIQKLTEIGVHKIIPLSMKRGVVKITEKKDKWDLIVKESLKQCQGVKPLIIDNVKKLQEIEYDKYDLVLVPYEGEDKEENTLRNILRNHDKKIEKILYIIGVEGGFSEEEIEFLIKKKAKIITLGKRILRAETASIVVGGVLVNEYQ